ncbi:MAG TPA: ATP-binding protein [Candidatus Thermoplasmatota archaeon]|nr:ATP-binding protein [Candidatus Thermoplasmatota archaeon]
MISKELVKEVLLDQREFILGKDPGIPRQAMKRIDEVINLPHVIVISGLRRCGKSTLLRQIIKNHYNDKDFFYVNFEDERLRDFNASEFNTIYEELLSLFGKKKVFMLDEIQNVDGFEYFVRRFQEMDFKFFITGSSAHLLSREIGTKLTGRNLRIDLYPFSFKELLTFKGINHKKEDLYKTERKVIIRNAFEEFMSTGGMPEYLKYKDQEILLRTYEDIVVKDIVIRYNLNNVRMVKNLYNYLISNVTNRFTFNSLKNTLGMGSSVTAQNYVDYLEEVNFCSIVHRFNPSIKKQNKSSKKFYMTDHGFLRPISTRLTKNKGKILENIIFIHLKHDGKVFTFETKKGECDFIQIKSNQVTQAIQVTWELTEKNERREIQGLLSALKEFDLNSGTIITYDIEKETVIDGKKIVIIPAWKWCLLHKDEEK